MDSGSLIKSAREILAPICQMNMCGNCPLTIPQSIRIGEDNTACLVVILDNLGRQTPHVCECKYCGRRSK